VKIKKTVGSLSSGSESESGEQQDSTESGVYAAGEWAMTWQKQNTI
jgi:hypothetical protein